MTSWVSAGTRPVQKFSSVIGKPNTLNILVTLDGSPVVRQILLFDRITFDVVKRGYSELDGNCYFSSAPLWTNGMFMAVLDNQESGATMFSLDFLETQLHFKGETATIAVSLSTEPTVPGSYLKVKYNGQWHVPEKVFVRQSDGWVQVADKVSYDELIAEKNAEKSQAVANKEAELNALFAPTLEAQYDSGYSDGLAAGTGVLDGDLEGARQVGYQEGYSKGLADGFIAGAASAITDPSYELPSDSNLTTQDDLLFESALIWTLGTSPFRYQVKVKDGEEWSTSLLSRYSATQHDIPSGYAPLYLDDFGSGILDVCSYEITYSSKAVAIGSSLAYQYPELVAYRSNSTGKHYSYLLDYKVVTTHPNVPVLSKHVPTESNELGYGINISSIIGDVDEQSGFSTPICTVIPYNLSVLNRPVVFEVTIHRKTAVGIPKLELGCVYTEGDVGYPELRSGSLSQTLALNVLMAGSHNQTFAYAMTTSPVDYRDGSRGGVLLDCRGDSTWGDEKATYLIIITPDGRLLVFTDLEGDLGFGRIRSEGIPRWTDSSVKVGVFLDMYDCIGENGENSVYINPGHKPFISNLADLSSYVNMDDGYFTLAGLLGMTDVGFAE